MRIPRKTLVLGRTIRKVGLIGRSEDFRLGTNVLGSILIDRKLENFGMHAAAFR